MGITFFALTEDQAKAVLAGQPKPPGIMPTSMAVQQQFLVTLDGETVTFKGIAARGATPKDKYNPDTFSGKLVPPGFVCGAASDTKQAEGIFRLWKEGAPEAARPAPMASGKTEKLACLDDANFHYTCYLPKSYDPVKPTPVLMNFSPGGDADPLSTKAAEEVGWISVGLTESKNGPIQPSNENRDAVLFDLRRRLNVDWKRVYFAGLSGGARAASWAGGSYPGMCAGMILIGGDYTPNFGNGAPPKDQAVVFIAGQGDPAKSLMETAHRNNLRVGRKSELIVHPGGHDWGRTQDHEAAIRWLEKETGKPAAATPKKP
jgi:dienelactone hydrolase